MQRPISITLFAALFGFAVVVSLLLAIYGRHTNFGFTLAPEAADTLALRIRAIRLCGIGFAGVLMLTVVLGRSTIARNALGLRWLLGLITSIAFLRGTGMNLPGNNDVAAITLSVIQLAVEGGAILVLYGEDAAAWFERRPAY